MLREGGRSCAETAAGATAGNIPTKGHCAYPRRIGLRWPCEHPFGSFLSLRYYQHWPAGMCLTFSLPSLYTQGAMACKFFLGFAFVWTSDELSLHMQANFEASIHPETPAAVLAAILGHRALADYLRGPQDVHRHECTTERDRQISQLLLQLLSGSSAPGISEDVAVTIQNLTRPFLDR